eukprot:TRINITY_DN10509_c0_g1_i7.p1 TRINITY_DN10509_c0_g1~~TRINITY_DN10509_c0_g1_i7.p1  ORF type:complete len:953 (+),score=249.63 TRINITY_DN10509_c0_g1_i7:298-3156(+)
MLLVNAIAKVVARPAEPYLVPFIPTVLEMMGDKISTVRARATEAGLAVMGLVCQHAVPSTLRLLYKGMELSQPWQVKEGAIAMLLSFAPSGQLGPCLPEIIPALVDVMWDTMPSTKACAKQAMTTVCALVGNSDLDPFLPVLINALASPEAVPEALYSLAATTFVQAVDSSALAVMVPLLLRGLKERKTALKRQVAVITDNMARLVKDPSDAEPFLAPLIPALKKLAEEISDADCSKVAQRAVATLEHVHSGVVATVRPDPADYERQLRTALSTPVADETNVALSYAGTVCAQFKLDKCFDEKVWLNELAPILSFVSVENLSNAVSAVVKNCKEEAAAAEEVIDEEEGEDLCNCEFSLAYGNKILLNCATMWLKRGKRYGLCGGNDCGKSTLMRSIANGQLEGFPPPEELKSIYLESDIQAEFADMPVIEFVCTDPELTEVPRDHTISMLSSVGFSDTMQGSPVGTLSGGWRMKLALARAMLKKADILLLDEPTNHLDKFNVRWLENYLMSLKDVTSIIVSHDAGMLDRVCTDIIHFEHRKLKLYRGNLTEFVKKVPEATSYYELATKKFSFKFPEPGYLEGVKSKSKVILRMNGVGFTYPGTTRKILTGVGIYCSLLSRVAVLGVNGAGKSTMIKLLTGELVPDEGEIVKHPNLRIAYVAQHAFHHLEQHLEKTPNEYIQWRYQGGMDKEGLEKVACQLTPADEKKMEEKHLIDGEKRQIAKLLTRRQLKKSYEYEVQWVGKPASENSWLPRTKLDDWGWGKMCDSIDNRDAAQAASLVRPLTQKYIQEHLEGVGLENEYSVHTQVRALSGGQKVKVVIGAAMWNNPHILILDEPTNYLDRDSLGALAGAIREFQGGVLMVSHHTEFTEALCGETWLVEGGVVKPLNQPSEYGAEGALEWKMAEEMIDGGGNTIKIKQKKTELTRKERIAREKRKKARRAAGEDSASSDED